jgi:hypothetical protein
MPKKTIKSAPIKKAGKNAAPIEDDEEFSSGDSLVWRCKCGHVEHASFPPEDCSKCLRISQFKKVNEDHIDNIFDEEILASREEDEDDY